MIKHTVLKTLIAAGSVRDVTIIGDAGHGFALKIHIGMQDHYLNTQRGEVRYWEKSDTLLKYLKGVGLGHARIDFTSWRPEGESL